MKRGWLYVVSLWVLLIVVGCTNDKQATSGASEQPIELMVSAAASLTDALEEMKASFEDEYPDIALTFNFASSGKLVQQIEQGAPSDIFLSASTKDMDKLQDEKLIDEATHVNFATNELVLIAEKDSTLSVDSFEAIDPASIAHFAIGEPESVPVGRYTKEVLAHLDLWEPLQSKVVLGSDVRQVLTHVAMGNADLGVVYSSDAKISNQVKVLAPASAEWHGPIVYPGAVVADSKHSEEAKAFLTFLTSEKGQEILKRFGFQ
ncbi:molybdate ABC transporter substrate-binding protein [Sporosarcina soli]|uniref:Molybdate ABC transporter substrate-binding protein n=1 Tax=Sporosarcina soli TaxID=334736 RepID=A0ABW0TMK1_9BACL